MHRSVPFAPLLDGKRWEVSWCFQHEKEALSGATCGLCTVLVVSGNANKTRQHLAIILRVGRTVKKSGQARRFGVALVRWVKYNRRSGTYQLQDQSDCVWVASCSNVSEQLWHQFHHGVAKTYAESRLPVLQDDLEAASSLARFTIPHYN